MMLAKQVRWIGETEAKERKNRLTDLRAQLEAAAEDGDETARQRMAALDAGADEFTEDEIAFPDSDELRRVHQVRADKRAELAAVKDAALHVSYGYGRLVHDKFASEHERNWTLVVDEICEASAAEARGEPRRLSEQEFESVVEAMRLDYQVLIFKRKYVLERAETQRWFERNKEKDGVLTEGKFQYQVLRSTYVGPFEPLAPQDTVQVHYRLMRKDKTELDSSYDKDPPVYVIDNVLIAWQFALLRMKPGDKYLLYQHPDIAYGITGWNKQIVPGGASLCELELVGYERANDATAKLEEKSEL